MVEVGGKVFHHSVVYRLGSSVGIAVALCRVRFCHKWMTFGCRGLERG